MPPEEPTEQLSLEDLQSVQSGISLRDLGVDLRATPED